jgi:hypothetical protein
MKSWSGKAAKAQFGMLHTTTTAVVDLPNTVTGWKLAHYMLLTF